MILLFVIAPPEYPFKLKGGEDHLLSLSSQTTTKMGASVGFIPISKLSGANRPTTEQGV